MLKIFLVEDEMIVRESLRKNVDWDKHGFEFVGEASDGELAYPQILKTKPDVIITDIRMPFMDGLELSKLVKQEMPWTKIIILSGYDDFQYAKEAIAIGVTEYLLKPASSIKIIETITDVKKAIEREREQRMLMMELREDIKENKKHENARFFENLVTKGQSVSELVEKAKELELDLPAAEYSMVLFKIFPYKIADELYTDHILNIYTLLEKRYSSSKEVLFFERSIEGYVLLVKGDTGTTGDLAIKHVTWLKGFFDEQEKVEYFIAVGQPVKRILEMSVAFDTANKAFAYQYIFEKNQIIFYSDIQRESNDYDEIMNLKNLNFATFDKKAIEQFLKNGSSEDINGFINRYFDSHGFENTQSLLFRQYITLDIQFIAVAFLEEMQINKTLLIERFGDADKIFSYFSSLEKTKNYIKRLLSVTVLLRDEARNNMPSIWFRNAQEYITNNYMNNAISLNMVSRAVNISPAHLSAMFSQQTGRTFIECVTEMRMNKAKELLRCTNLKSFEIAYEVGYKDPHYFSHLFKKTFGCTPKEFRSGKVGSV